MSADAPNTPKLTDKQQRFVEEYCVDWNGTQAAIRAGYSDSAAAEIAYENLRKPHIRAAIDERLTTLSLSAGETTKLISEIAQTSVNDFVVVKKVEHTPKIAQPLAEAIALLEKEIAFDEEYAARSVDILGFIGEQRVAYLSDKQYDINKKRLQVLRWQMQLDRDPDATTVVNGKPELVDRAELDLVKLAQAKERNRIKSWQPSEFGIKVEMYDALGALRDMGRVHGIFEKDNTQAAATAVINAKVEVISSGVPIARSEKEAADNV
ncbi:terminase small subunit [Hymenobacter sp. GOD-10R]|uniref:terminase small subunit n=1 Tax=Hymenobacter sp. GOD-10R TaxID=3093922 RepID=UPI002D771897|nr:terminase small subunit [Hymenobacter sp. GOD-10R]WRQ26688.1 terminase small subunit [Hymenobacter sp. GOD-10R]